MAFLSVVKEPGECQVLQGDLVELALAQIGDRVYTPTPRLKARMDPDEALMFVTLPGAARSVRRHVLNQTAAAIYRLLDGQRTVAEIVALFAARFPDLPPAELAYSIVRFVRTLERKGLVQPVSGPSQAQAPIGATGDAN